ncbi:hypothetical protein LXA43DRAFT_857569, partial [Ganoderma leucocontextum]
NGRWIGKCPSQLQGLSYVEQLLISLYRHNYCVAQVRQGQRFMVAHAIIFQQPVSKVYSVLPPPRKDLDDCLAILFTGSAKPSDEDFSRTPFLVRHCVVLRALQWLKWNHPDYADIEISTTNLQTYYPEGQPPVSVLFRERSHMCAGEDGPVYENKTTDATDDSECTFIVHGLSAEDLSNITYEAKIAAAVKYFDEGGAALGIGHNYNPQ